MKAPKILRTKIEGSYKDLDGSVKKGFLESEILPETFSIGSSILTRDYVIKNGERIPIGERVTVLDKNTIDSLFTGVGEDILHTESFTDRFLDLMVKAQWLDIQQNPEFLLSPSDFEQVDNV